MSLSRMTAATPRQPAVRTAPLSSSLSGAVHPIRPRITAEQKAIVDRTWEAREAHQDRMEKSHEQAS